MVQLLDTIKVKVIFSVNNSNIFHAISNTYKLMSSIWSRFNKNEFQNCSNEEKGESNALIINGFEHYVSTNNKQISMSQLLGLSLSTSFNHHYFIKIINNSTYEKT